MQGAGGYVFSHCDDYVPACRKTVFVQPEKLPEESFYSVPFDGVPDPFAYGYPESSGILVVGKDKHLKTFRIEPGTVLIYPGIILALANPFMLTEALFHE